MKKRLILTIIVALAASSVLLAAGMPAGSFLKSPASSASQLASQVNDDAIVSARYARHFGVSRNLVVAYFRDELRPARLKSDYETTVYTVSGRTDIVAVRKTLPAGTYVFIDGSNRPVIVAATGNPIAASLPTPRPAPMTSYPAPAQGATSAASVLAATPSTGADLTAIPVTLAPVVGDEVLAASAPALAGIAPAVEAVATVPVQSPVMAAAPSAGTLLPLALLGAALSGGGGGGGHTYVREPDPVSEIPEPMSAAAVGLGISAMGLGRLRRRK